MHVVPARLGLPREELQLVEVLRAAAVAHKVLAGELGLCGRAACERVGQGGREGGKEGVSLEGSEHGGEQRRRTSSSGTSGLGASRIERVLGS